ncbi:dihydrodipicolinate synthase family protein [Candidatus Woesearchaeota archaeon]|nr:dihydrodipicolinate synthase family protein [Candidatus Woesearchaeota archaeon]
MGKSLEQIREILGKGTSIIQPLPTPLERVGEGLDSRVAREIVERAFSHGFHVFARSTTGAAPVAPEGTSRSLIALASDLGRGRDGLVFAGVPQRGTEETIQYIDGFLGQTREVDVAVLPPPPHFFLTPEQVLYHVKEVHDKTTMPIALYEFERLFGTSYVLGILSEALGLDRIIGMKSSNPREYTSKALHIAHMRQKFLWVGSETDALYFSQQGCDGFVPSGANVVPLLFKRLQLLPADDNQEMQSLNLPIWNAIQSLYPGSRYREGIIYAMHVLFGADKKLPRPLEYGLTPVQEKTISEYLSHAIGDGILGKGFEERVTAELKRFS